MNKTYKILLDGEEIGTSKLEKADAPMGVVFGEIIFDKNEWNYDSIKSFCLTNSVDFPFL